MRALVWLMLALGCVACVRDPVARDGASGDAVAEDVRVLRDVVPGPVTRGNPTLEIVGDSVLLHPLNDRIPSTTQCLGLPSRGVPSSSNYAPRSCRIGDWYYHSNYGAVTRANLRTGVGQYLVKGPVSYPRAFEAEAAMDCQGSRVVMRIHTRRAHPNDPTRSTIDRVMIVIFDDVERLGRIVWSRWPSVDESPRVGIELTATERFIAWNDFFIGAGPAPYYPRVMVAGPNGELAAPLAPGPDTPDEETGQMTSEAADLIWRTADGIQHYNVDSRVREELTGDRAYQWSPYLHHRRVVWVDQRDQPAGTIQHPNNPEIYLFDLDTRERRRITVDPSDRPVGQTSPIIVGDWIVWSDFRNALDPNPAQWFATRMELFGYHIPTGQTVPVLTGDIQSDLVEDLDDGVLTVSCRDSPMSVDAQQPLRTIGIPLPTVASDGGV